MTNIVGAGGWERVSPKYIWVVLASELIPGIVVTVALSVVATVLRPQWLVVLPIASGVIVILLLAFTPRRVRSIGYCLREDDLVFRRGIMWHRAVAVPYGRMQLVDISRGPIARALGLAELKLVTAAAATGVTIPGLTQADAEALRDHLVALAETRRAAL